MNLGKRRIRRARAAITAAVLAAAALAGAPAHATLSCAPTGTPGVERCVAGMPAGMLTQMFEAQRASNWCWAATVTMVLRRYGAAVSQEQVVHGLVGREADVQASAPDIAHLLAQPWQDAAGGWISGSTEFLPPWRRSLGLSAPEVLEDLAQDRPLVVGANGHAMVLVQVVYERRPTEVRLLRAVVLDPQSGAMVRGMTATERQPEFVARVHMRPADAPADDLAPGLAQ